jgi:hypothetical protein
MNLISPPVGFVDRTPRRGPWVCTSTPPRFYATPQLLFADGRTGGGTWLPPLPPARLTAMWYGWCDLQHRQTILEPIGWREVEPAHSC